METKQGAEARSAAGKRAALTGVLCNLALAGGKLAAGSAAGAMSVFADGLNNLSDCASSLVSLLGFRLAERPADSEHPYGHARYEYLAGLSVAVLILLIGLELAKSSVEKILRPAPVDASALTFAVLAASILVKLWMFFFYRRQGRAINSTALLASAADSRNDAITTAAVLIAAIAERAFGWRVDGAMSGIVSVFILWGGVELVRETMSPLLGEGAKPALQKQIADYVLSCPEVLSCHDLLVHDYGPGRRYASLHVEMDRKEDPMASHDTIDRLERGCLSELGIHLVIHYDPVVTDDAEQNRLHRLVAALVRLRDSRLSVHDFRLRRGDGDAPRLEFDMVVPSALLGQKEEIRQALEDAVEALEGRRYPMDITFDISGL